MPPLPDDATMTLQNKLKEELTRITARRAELMLQDPFSDPDRLTDNAATDTEANEESSHDRFAALVEELTAQQTALTQALSRMQAGTYGTCTSCGDAIDAARLLAMPTAELCIVCEQKKH